MNRLASDLLRILAPNRAYGIGEEELLADLRSVRHRALTRPELQAALRDLADQAWAAPFTSPLSGKRWRITALGTSVLAEEGLD